MKNRLSNFLTSLKLDSTPPEDRGSGENLYTQVAAVHQALSKTRPLTQAPKDLHRGIMNAVEASGARTFIAPRSAEIRNGLLIRFAIAGTACCIFALLAGIVMKNVSAPSSDGLASVSWTIEQTKYATASLDVLGALEQESASLSLDLRAAASHLLASVP